MKDLYLRTQDESEMTQALQSAGLYTTDEETGELVLDTGTQTDVSIIGEMQEQTGTETVDGEEVPVYQAVPGWHVNVRSYDQAVIDALQPLAIEPNTPQRVWAD